MAAQDFRVKNGIVVAGNASLTGILYPTSDGTNRQVIMTDGAGTLSFENLDTVHTDAVNQTSTDIPIGTPVYQVGTSGNAIEVAPADASDPAKMPAVGVVETTITANGGTGFVTHIGQVSGVDTQTPGFSEGDVIYVAVGGGYTNAAPTGEGNLIQNLGIVTKIHPSNGGGIIMGAGRSNAVPNLDDGNIFIGNSSNQAITNTLDTSIVPENGNLYYTDSRADARISAADLGDLGDVDLSTPQTDGQALLWDAGTSTWVPGNNETVTSLTAAGNILTYVNEAGTNQTIDLSLYLDDTNLARITSGSLAPNGIATFTRDDATSFTIDFSQFFDDTNLARITSASFNNSTGDLTLTRDDATTVTANLDGRYLTSFTETNDLTSAVTWANVPDANITQSSVTQHQAALSITESQISDLQSYLTGLSGESVGDLSDVDITTSAPTNGQALVWDNANSKFVPGDVTASFLGLTDTASSFGTAGQAVIVNAGANGLEFGDVTADFLGLTDTPGSFGTAGQAVIVNSGATGLEFGDVTADFTGLTDSPSSYSGQGDRVVKVNSAETGVEFGDLVAGSTVRESYTGDGTTTDFTTTATFSGQNDLLVFVDAVIQYPGSDFTLSGNTLTFLSAPNNGAEILLYGLTRITSVVTPGDGTVTAAKLAASAYTRDTFNGDNSTTSFTLTRDPGTVYSPFIYVDGVIQDPITHYTISGTTLTFTFTPATGTDNIVVIYGPTNVASTVSDGSVTFAKLAPGNFQSQIETGDGTTTDFVLDQQTSTADHIIVTVAGVPQAPDGVPYTLINNGNTISFTSAPSNGAKIVIRWYATTTYQVPPDDSVTTAMIQDGAITSDKIATGGVATVDMADGSVTSLKIANGGIATEDLADDAVTPAKLDREYATKGTSIALSIALG